MPKHAAPLATGGMKSEWHGNPRKDLASLRSFWLTYCTVIAYWLSLHNLVQRMQHPRHASAERSEMPPLVSVVIPAYNAAATIRRAVDSALAQTYHPIEVIVIDDCSQDATAKIMSTYADERIRFLRLPYNHGAGGVLNPGISIAE